MFTYGAVKEDAMVDDANGSSDSSDDLHILAGVIALVSIALMATAVLA